MKLSRVERPTDSNMYYVQGPVGRARHRVWAELELPPTPGVLRVVAVLRALVAALRVVPPTRRGSTTR